MFFIFNIIFDFSNCSQDNSYRLLNQEGATTEQLENRDGSNSEIQENLFEKDLFFPQDEEHTTDGTVNDHIQEINSNLSENPYQNEKLEDENLIRAKNKLEYLRSLSKSIENEGVFGCDEAYRIIIMKLFRISNFLLQKTFELFLIEKWFLRKLFIVYFEDFVDREEIDDIILAREIHTFIKKQRKSLIQENNGKTKELSSRIEKYLIKKDKKGYFMNFSADLIDFFKLVFAKTRFDIMRDGILVFRIFTNQKTPIVLLDLNSIKSPQFFAISKEIVWRFTKQYSTTDNCFLNPILSDPRPILSIQLISVFEELEPEDFLGSVDLMTLNTFLGDLKDLNKFRLFFCNTLLDGVKDEGINLNEFFSKSFENMPLFFYRSYLRKIKYEEIHNLRINEKRMTLVQMLKMRRSTIEELYRQMTPYNYDKNNDQIITEPWLKPHEGGPFYGETLAAKIGFSQTEERNAFEQFDNKLLIERDRESFSLKYREFKADDVLFYTGRIKDLEIINVSAFKCIIIGDFIFSAFFSTDFENPYNSDEFSFYEPDLRYKRILGKKHIKNIEIENNFINLKLDNFLHIYRIETKNKAVSVFTRKINFLGQQRITICNLNCLIMSDFPKSLQSFTAKSVKFIPVNEKIMFRRPIELQLRNLEIYFENCIFTSPVFFDGLSSNLIKIKNSNFTDEHVMFRNPKLIKTLIVESTYGMFKISSNITFEFRKGDQGDQLVGNFYIVRNELLQAKNIIFSEKLIFPNELKRIEIHQCVFKNDTTDFRLSNNLKSFLCTGSVGSIIFQLSGSKCIQTELQPFSKLEIKRISKKLYFIFEKVIFESIPSDFNLKKKEMKFIDCYVKCEKNFRRFSS